MSGLDVTTALVLKTVIKTLGQRGKAIFYCSHVLEVVEQVCSDLLILRKGNVIASGPAEAIQGNANHASLERTFMHLVEEADTDQVSADIIRAMEG
jgi:ABC-2 type transport system ATP-binding protein